MSELYLELHRGTATSHGSIKRHNRKTEVLLHDLELVATLASLYSAKDAGTKAYSYPKDEIDSLWEDMLLCQFHDVLPGSAIGMVYDDVEKVPSTTLQLSSPTRAERHFPAQIYADVQEKGAALLDSALNVLVPNSKSLAHPEALDSLVAFDTLGLPRRELVKVPMSVARALDDAALQRSHDGEAYVLFDTTGGTIVTEPVSVNDTSLSRGGSSARGAAFIVIVPETSFSTNDLARMMVARLAGTDHVLSTDKLQVVISKEGRITSIVDRELDRELILPNKNAGFVIFQDT